jgi:hypothetical protein
MKKIILNIYSYYTRGTLTIKIGPLVQILTLELINGLIL